MTSSLLFLLITSALLLVFVLLMVRIWKPSRRDDLEKPKHRMLEED